MKRFPAFSKIQASADSILTPAGFNKIAASAIQASAGSAFGASSTSHAAAKSHQASANPAFGASASRRQPWRFLCLLIACLWMPLAQSQTYDMRAFIDCEPNDYSGGMAQVSSKNGSYKILKTYYEGDTNLGFAIGGYTGSAAVYDGDGQYLVCVDGKKIVPLSTETGVVNTSGIKSFSSSQKPWAWTWDYEDEVIYGCFGDGSAPKFGWIDPTDGTYTVHETSDCIRWTACAAAPDGSLYAIGASDGVLYRVNKDTGVHTKVGSTGQTPPSLHVTAAAIDWTTGKMYWQNIINSEYYGALYEVNLTTGAATRLWAFADYTAMLAFDFPYEKSGSDLLPPSVPTSLAAAFAGGALSGTVSFTAPTTTADGKAQSGEGLTYKIQLNGVEKASGACSYGQKVSAAVSVASAGLYTVRVAVSNEAGEGQAVETELWIGPDQPLAVGDVNLSYASGRFTLTWTAPAGGVHGGFFDVSGVTYTVKRYGTGETVASGLTACTFTDEVGTPSAPELYRYAVQAVQQGQASEWTTSGARYAGAYDVPWAEDFNDEARGLTSFTVIDGGDPDYTWQWRDNSALIYTYGHQQADDWLITPPVHLEAGVAYWFRLDAACGGSGSNADERLSVFCGAEPSVQAMTKEILPETTVDQNVLTPYGAAFTIEQTGDYCFGMRCTSKIHFFLQIDNLAIRRQDAVTSPSVPTEVQIVPDYDGALRAEISAKAPKVDFLGDPLGVNLDRVEFFLNETLVYAQTDVAPGAAVSYTAEVAEAGYYALAVRCSNAAGVSATVADTCYIGINRPAPVASLHVEETSTWGEARLTWDAPVTDCDGRRLNPQLVRYDIFSDEGDVVAEDFSGTTFTFTAVPADAKQQYRYYSILARTDKGYADAPAYSSLYCLGRPETLPYEENFAGGQVTQLFAAAVTMGSGAVSVVSDTEGPGSYEGDDGCLRIEGTPSMDETNLDVICLYSGKIEISGTSPALSFYYKGNGLGSTNSFKVYVAEWNGPLGFVEASATTYTTNVSNQWERVQIPLTDYVGQTLRFMIEVQNVNDRFTYIDHLSIDEMPQHDLAVYNLALPSTARTGSEISASVMVQNFGAAEARDWCVQLLRAGTVVDEAQGIALTSGSPCLVYLYDTPPVTAAGQTAYTARVVWDSDAVEANNETSEALVEVRTAPWPRPTSISGELTAEGEYHLAWDAPLGADDGEQTEDFEQYEPWATAAVGDWGLVDWDGLNILGMSSIAMPVAGSPAGFFVFDFTGFSSSEAAYCAHSGTQAMASMGSSKGTCEDWLVSPILDGSEQEISFFARAFNSWYADMTFEVLISSDASGSLMTFVPTEGQMQATPEWTQYTCTVPEGTKYFAIACYQPMYSAMFFVDDVQYASGVHSVKDLTGYRIYRDDQPMADVSKDEARAWTDRSVGDRATGHVYYVTALYEKGESAPSERVAFGTADIAPVVCGRADGGQAYDLSGRRATKATRGIVIAGGRKVVR